MKKLIVTLICFVLLIGVMSTPALAAIGDSASEPYYNNALRINSKFSIDSDGVASVYVSYTGRSGVTSSVYITSKIQKQNSNGSWSDVNNGMTNNLWIDASTNVRYSNTHTLTVSRGTYRAVINYTINGSGGVADVQEDIISYTF